MQEKKKREEQHPHAFIADIAAAIHLPLSVHLQLLTLLYLTLPSVRTLDRRGSLLHPFASMWKQISLNATKGSVDPRSFGSRSMTGELS